MITHNIGFYEDLTKIIFQLSSNSSEFKFIRVSELLISLVYHFPDIGKQSSTKFNDKQNSFLKEKHNFFKEKHKDIQQLPVLLTIRYCSQLSKMDLIK